MPPPNGGAWKHAEGGQSAAGANPRRTGSSHFLRPLPPSAAADVYSLGASLYALVYGVIPFAASSVAELFEALRTREVELPPQPAVSPDLADLLLGCLAKVRPRAAAAAAGRRGLCHP